MDGIGFRRRHNLENKSKPSFHSFAVSSESREMLLNEFHFQDLVIPHVLCSILTYYNLWELMTSKVFRQSFLMARLSGKWVVGIVEEARGIDCCDWSFGAESILKGGFYEGWSGCMNAPAQDIRDGGSVWVEFLRQRDVLSLRKGNAQAARCTGGTLGSSKWWVRR